MELHERRVTARKEMRNQLDDMQKVGSESNKAINALLLALVKKLGDS